MKDVNYALFHREHHQSDRHAVDTSKAIANYDTETTGCISGHQERREDGRRGRPSVPQSLSTLRHGPSMIITGPTRFTHAQRHRDSAEWGRRNNIFTGSHHRKFRSREKVARSTLWWPCYCFVSHSSRSSSLSKKFTISPARRCCFH